MFIMAPYLPKMHTRVVKKIIRIAISTS